MLKDYGYGLLLALLCCFLLLGVLYGAAVLLPEPCNMSLFLGAVAIGWPLLAGSLAGVLDVRNNNGNGFAAALRWVIIPLLLLGVLWWWLFAELWQIPLYGKFALYVIVAAIVSGGLSAGIAKARQILYPPPEDNGDKEDNK